MKDQYRLVSKIKDIKAKRSKQIKQNRTMKKAISRIICLAFLFIFTGIGLIGKITYLKVVKGDKFEKEVTNRTAGSEYEIQPLRGSIVDRNGKNLVISAVAYDVILDPHILLEAKEEEREKTLQHLTEVLDLNKDELRTLVNNNPESKYQVIAKEIPSNLGEELREAKLKGLWLQETFVRKYPKETLASQTIGFYNKNKQGQYGIEQEYNDKMTGFAGRVFPMLQEGNIVTSESVSAVSGHTLVITIDEIIQQYIEEALEKSAKAVKSKNAAAIALNPNTGEVLAMAGFPTYNPNKYNDMSNVFGKEVWDSLSESEKGDKLNEIWKNYNIHMTYEPGSTIKPIVIAAALEEGVISKDEHFYCPGVKEVAGESIHCANRSGHGDINLEEAIAKSCNIAMMEIGEKLGKEKFIRYQKEFGLGAITGIDLPGEEEGILHRPDQMGPVELATASFGQGFNMTPLQLISAFSATINGGKLMRPYVLSQVIDEDGNIVEENKPIIRRKVISKEVSDIVRLQSESVVTDGTGKNAAIEGYRIGGKTGTAQKLPREAKEYIYSFIGYAPVENPEIVMLVIFDETEDYSDGVGLASRVFNEMMTKILPYLEIYPVEGTAEPKEELVVNPDFTGLEIYQAVEMLHSNNLTYEPIGVGKEVDKQYPKPGTKIPKGSKIKLYFKSDKPENCNIVPDCIGKTLEEAKIDIENSGFTVETSGEGDIVTSQIPKTNMKIEKSSVVKLILKEENIE